jgi:hypothetical protein
MLHLNSKGYNSGDNSGNFDPVLELKGLLAAVYASINNFEHCLETPAASGLHEVAAACRDIQRVNQHMLTERLVDLGDDGMPGIDLWHAFLELFGTTATVFGEEAILVSLRKHELALLTHYEDKGEHFDCDNLLLIKGTLIPNQIKVCELLGAIKTDIAATVKSSDLPLQLNWGATT